MLFNTRRAGDFSSDSEEVKDEIREEGKQEIHKQTVNAIIRICKKLELIEDAIIEVLQADFSISRSQALKYIETENDFAKAW